MAARNSDIDQTCQLFDRKFTPVLRKRLIFEIRFVKLLIASRNGICCANRAIPATVEKDAPTGK